MTSIENDSSGNGLADVSQDENEAVSGPTLWIEACRYKQDVLPKDFTRHLQSVFPVVFVQAALVFLRPLPVPAVVPYRATICSSTSGVKAGFGCPRLSYRSTWPEAGCYPFPYR